MMEDMIMAVIKKTLSTKYPHLILPAIVYATVSAPQLLDGWYEYTVTIVDQFGNAAGNYPTIPGVRSRTQYEPGAVVAVALPYGSLAPVIIGEVSL